MLHHCDERVDIGCRESKLRTNLTDQLHPNNRVIARVALAEIVKQSAEHEEVGSGHAVDEQRCVGSGFPQMPVNSEAMIGVALRLRPVRFPFRKQSSKQFSLIERLKDTDRTVPFEQQRHKLGRGANGPRALPRFDFIVQSVERAASNPAVIAGSSDRCLKNERGVSNRVGRIGQFDLTITKHDARRNRAVWQAVCGGDGSAPVLVDKPRNGPPGCCNVGHQVVGITPAAGLSRRVLVLEAEDVARSSGGTMERDSRSEENVVATLEFPEIFRKDRQPALVRPLERLNVAQAAVAQLKIGFKPVRHVASIVLAFAHSRPQTCQESVAVLVPAGPPLGRHFVGKVAVTGEKACREQRRCGVQICTDDRQLFLGGADCMTEFDACIPQRIPECTRYGLDSRGSLFAFQVVDKQQVEVAPWSEFAASEPADGQESEPTLRRRVLVNRCGEQRTDPVVGDASKRRAVGPAAMTKIVRIRRSRCVKMALPAARQR